MKIRHSLTLLLILIVSLGLASVVGAQDNPLSFTIDQQTGRMTFENKIDETVTLISANGGQNIVGHTTFDEWWVPREFLQNQCSTNGSLVHTDDSGKKYVEIKYSYEWRHTWGGDKISGRVTSWYYCDNLTANTGVAASTSSSNGSSVAGSNSGGNSVAIPDPPDQTNCYVYASKPTNLRTDAGEFLIVGQLTNKHGWQPVHFRTTGDVDGVTYVFAAIDVSDQGVVIAGVSIPDFYVAIIANRTFLSPGCK